MKLRHGWLNALTAEDFDGTVGDRFFARWMTLLMDPMVGSQYEKGLEALKLRCEGSEL